MQQKKMAEIPFCVFLRIKMHMEFMRLPAYSMYVFLRIKMHMEFILYVNLPTKWLSECIL